MILTGKGNKTRRVPIMKNTAVLVEAYISENRLGLAHKTNYPLFTNRQHNKLTKEGVAYVIEEGTYIRIVHSESSLPVICFIFQYILYPVSQPLRSP